MHEFVYDDPSERPITDVDALVPEADYGRALESLRSAGFQLRTSNVFQTVLLAPGLPLPLDLHRRLFARSSFHMPSRELFARGQHDRERYGVELVLPAPRDVFAHLVGHFVKSRGGEDSQRFQLRDFGALAERCALEPRSTAEHLVDCGLARASRYALLCVPSELDARGFCRSTLAALPRDHTGSACATSMLRLRKSVSARSSLAMLPGFVLEPSLPAAVGSFALRAWDHTFES